MGYRVLYMCTFAAHSQSLPLWNNEPGVGPLALNVSYIVQLWVRKCVKVEFKIIVWNW